MSAFSVFQASFDGGLRPHQHRRGRLAAIALISAAIAVIGGSVLAILHLNSNQLSNMANAGSPRDVRLATSVTTQDKSCAEQSWPFIEGRCLIDTRSLRRTERAIPRHITAARPSETHEVALVSRKKKARTKSPDGATVVATRSRPVQTAASTTGAAPRNDATSAPVKATNIANATPAETPSVTTPPTATPAASPTPPQTDNAIAPRRAPDLRREARRRERLTREQREARAELRSRRDEQRSASRGNDSAYSSSYSGGWQRGPFDGGFFSTIR